MKFMSASVAVALAVTAPACLAANARNPYGNIDPSNDAGNDTGDLQVEALNQAQIDGGSRAPAYPRYAPAPGAYGSPDGYPAQGYAPAASYPQPPSYQPAQAYAPPGYAPYPQAPSYALPGYAPAYGSGPYAAPGYYAPSGYAPPGYPPQGYAPPPGY